MTINRDKLVKLLVEKTEMSVSDVETQLDELINRIIDAARRGKALEIKGFGLFYFDEEGELSFKPSDQLDKEINFQYAGMEPIDLKSGKTAPTPKSEEKKTEAKAGSPVQPGSGKGKADKKEEQPAKESGDDVFGIGKTLTQQDAGEDDRGSDPFGKLFRDEPTGAKPQKKEEIRKAGTTSGKKSTAAGTPKKKPAGKKKDPMMLIILIILAVIAIPVGYMIITEYLEAPEPAAEQTEQTIEPTEPPVTAETDVTEPEEPATLDEVEVAEPSPAADEETVETAPDSEFERYGLMGEIVEAEGDEFSIVVHSFQTRNQAENTAESLRQEGYRTSVTERIVNDSIVFRVGIGQFPSVQAAQNEAENLPEPYRNQNFIQRIQ